MTAHAAAPRTKRCGEKVAYRTEEEALRVLVQHDREACRLCRTLRKVMNVYRCGSHLHLGHCALGYDRVDYRR